MWIESDLAGVCTIAQPTSRATEIRGPHSRAFLHTDAAGVASSVCHPV
jgi:hypothetical protein